MLLFIIILFIMLAVEGGIDKQKILDLADNIHVTSLVYNVNNDTASLISVLQTNKRITELRLTGSTNHPHICDILSALANNTTVTVFHLCTQRRYVDTSNELGLALMQLISTNTTIHYYRINLQMLEASDLTLLGDAFQYNTTMTTLCLDNINLQHIAVLDQCMPRLVAIKHLKLASLHNPLTSNIINWIIQCNTIKTLKLGHPSSASQLKQILQYATKLYHIHFNFHCFPDEDMDDIADLIVAHPIMRSLSLVIHDKEIMMRVEHILQNGRISTYKQSSQCNTLQLSHSIDRLSDLNITGLTFLRYSDFADMSNAIRQSNLRTLHVTLDDIPNMEYLLQSMESSVLKTIQVHGMRKDIEHLFDKHPTFVFGEQNGNMFLIDRICH